MNSSLHSVLGIPPCWPVIAHPDKTSESLEAALPPPPGAHCKTTVPWLLGVLTRTEPLQRAIVPQPTQMQSVASLQLMLAN